MSEKHMKRQVSYKELRDHIQNLEKYPGCKKLARAPLIHEGFPGTFNLSFTEYDYLREFGNLSNFYKDFAFSTIQSCVRYNDIDESIRSGKNLWKYLGVFEMADLTGAVILSNQRRADEIHAKNVQKLIGTLRELKLDINKVHPSYNAGATVAEITKGKYNFDFTVPEDTLSREEFLKAGVPSENLIADRTRDTFLSLQIAGMKTPWGYRSEVNYNLGTKENPKLLDIGTLERCLWFPTYDGTEKASNINGLEEMPHTFAISIVGLERLCTAINGLQEIKDVDFIKKFYDSYMEIAPELSENQRYRAGEVIRAMHRIQSDISANQNLKWTQSRAKKRRRLMQLVYDNHPTLKKEQLEELLNVHAEVQPWHVELKQGIAPTVDLILNYLDAKR